MASATSVASSLAALANPFATALFPEARSKVSVEPLKAVENGPQKRPPVSVGSLDLPGGVVPGSRLEIRPAPLLVSSGIPAIDEMAGGLPRGALTEIYGPASSGRTSLLLSALAAATQRQEVCALVDVSDAFHPESGEQAGIDLARLLWVRCDSVSPYQQEINAAARNVNAHNFRGQQSRKNLTVAQGRLLSAPRPEKISKSGWEKRLEQALKVTDLLLQSSGFGLVVVDLADVPAQFARRVPLTSWFRFRRAVENTPTILLAIEQEPYARTCASLVLEMQALNDKSSAFSTQQSEFSRVASVMGSNEKAPTHTNLLSRVPLRAEVRQARLHKKLPQRAAEFESATAWAG